MCLVVFMMVNYLVNFKLCVKENYRLRGDKVIVFIGSEKMIYIWDYIY